MFLCLGSMWNVGISFTLDLIVLAWLEEYAKKEKMSESALVNSILNSVKRRSETWECSECGGTNVNESTVCYADPDCEGVKAWFVQNVIWFGLLTKIVLLPGITVLVVLVS